MTVWTPMDDGFADLTSHDTFTQGAPHNTFARLRREDPVHWTEYPQGESFWSLTRHEDIHTMNGRPDLLSSARGIRMEDQSYEEYLARRTFQETDAPEHMMTRVKVAKAFSKNVVAGFETAIRDLCTGILDTALEKGTFDATKEVARELPMRMLGRIVGLPDEDLPWLVEKGDALIANTDPDFTPHVLDKLTTDEFRMMPFNSPAGAELFVYAKDLMKRKEAAGDTSGVLHMILQPGHDGSVMPEIEFRNFFCLVVAAGNDTTRYSIAAGLQALAHQPELLPLIQSGAVDDTMADEIIRWASPTSYFRRISTCMGKRSRRARRSCTGSLRPTGMRRSLTNPSALTSHGHRTSTSPSARVARIFALACGWRGWKSGCCFRNLPSGSSRSNRRASRNSCARTLSPD